MNNVYSIFNNQITTLANLYYINNNNNQQFIQYDFNNQVNQYYLHNHKMRIVINIIFRAVNKFIRFEHNF